VQHILRTKDSSPEPTNSPRAPDSYRFANHTAHRISTVTTQFVRDFAKLAAMTKLQENAMSNAASVSDFILHQNRSTGSAGDPQSFREFHQQAIRWQNHDTIVIASFAC
jgi:hypothetical protein